MYLGDPTPKAVDTPLYAVIRRCTPLYAGVRRCTLCFAVVSTPKAVYTQLYAVVCGGWDPTGGIHPHPPDGVPVTQHAQVVHFLLANLLRQAASDPCPAVCIARCRQALHMALHSKWRIWNAWSHCSQALQMALPIRRTMQVELVLHEPTTCHNIMEPVHIS